PLVGWAVVYVNPDPRTLIVWILGAFGVLGCYFAAQAFQQQEDSSRGYQTLVVTHGPATVIFAARLCIGIGFIGALILAIIGWIPRVCLAGILCGIWVDRWFRLWAKEPDGGSEAWARGMAKRLLVAGLVALTFALGEYVRASLAGEPVAGLGTVAGHPPDRPRLPHWRMPQ
ncbi:MAG: hypothetical protein HN348_09025, partial [Proteobacteria bacterium]|nr:hypothetical protein [Pseudomonadota bacterium]